MCSYPCGMFLERIRTIMLFPLRSAVSIIGLYAYWMETAADFVVGASSSTEYVRRGSCNRCGKCCQLLAVEMPGWLAKRPWMIRIVVSWHELVYNFEPRGIHEHLLVYSCRYYRDDRRGGGCSIYPFRHRICRFFPKQHLYGKYDLGGDCGFRFMKRDVAKRIEARRKRGDRPFADYLEDNGGEGGRMAL